MKYGTLYAYWTREWSGDYLFYLDKAHKLGFDTLEISAAHLPDMTDQELHDLANASKRLGMTITANIGPKKEVDISSSDPLVRINGMKYFEEIFVAMKKLNCDILVGVIFSHWPYDFIDLDKEAIWERAVESVRKLSEVADKYDIDLALEVVNRFENNLLNTAEEGVRFCKDVDHPRAKLLLDTFHMNIEEDSIPGAIRKSKDYLIHLHIGEANRKVPGKGHIPWKEIGLALKDINFDRAVVMEPFVKQGGQVGEDIRVWRDLSDAKNVDELDNELQESLEYLKYMFE